VEIEIGPPEIAIRLLLTLVAGAIVGVNRSERGRAAGFRTTILVCLTASASMILGNFLLGTTGRPFNSFVTMDVMRLPLEFSRVWVSSEPAQFFTEPIWSLV